MVREDTQKDILAYQLLQHFIFMLVGKEKMLSFLKKITVGQVQVEMVAGMVAVQVYGMAQMTIAVVVVEEPQILEL